MEKLTPSEAYKLLNKLLPESGLMEDCMSNYYDSDEVRNISTVDKFFDRELDYMEPYDLEVITDIVYDLEGAVREYGNNIRIVLNDILDNILNNITNEH